MTGPLEAHPLEARADSRVAPQRLALLDDDSPLQLIIVTDQLHITAIHNRWTRMIRGAPGKGPLAAELEAMLTHLWKAKRCLDRAAEQVLDTEAQRARGSLAARAAAARAVS